MTVLSLLLIAWLPGAVAFRLPIAHRERRAALPTDERAFWAVLISIAWSLAVVLGLGLAGHYRFGRLLAVNAGLAACLAAAARGRLGYGGTANRVTLSALVPVAIACAGCWLYLPPAEYVLGGKDPGVYLNEGIQIAQRGGLVIDDPIVREVPASLRELFIPPYGSKTYYSVRFMGFFVRDPDRGQVIGQFPHLFPASIAIGYGLNGLSGARQTVVVWAVLGLIAVYFTGARLVGRLAAALAVALLAVNVVEVWFGRYPNAEVVMQTLLFAAILAFARALEGNQAFFGVVSASLLGLLMFLRYDAVLAVAAFAAAATLAPFNRQSIGWRFVACLGAALIGAFIYLTGPMRAYSEGLLGYTRDQGGWLLLAGGAVVAWGSHQLARRERWASVVRRAVPMALAAVLVTLAAYAFFLREPAGRTAAFDAYAFRTFAWYVTRAGLLAGVAGLAVLLPRLFWRDPAFWITTTVYSVFFFYKTRIVPEHFWSARRFLAATLPGLLLVIAGAAVFLCRDWAPGRLRAHAAAPGPDRTARIATAIGGLLACLVLLPLGISFWKSAAPVRQHIEYAGLIPQLEQLASSLGDNDLVLVESRSASDMHVLALPLAYVYARNVLVLASARPPRALFEAFVSWAGTRYDRVLFLGGGGSDLLGPGLSAEPLESERFQVPEYDTPKEAYPQGPRRKEFDYGLYRIAPASGQPATLPMSIRIGTFDDLHAVRFNAKEARPDGVPYRWSRDVSYVVVPSLPAAARRVTIWMSNGGRPASDAAATVEVSLDDRLLGSATPDDVLRPYSFPLPAQRPEPATEAYRIRLKTPTWNPRKALGVPDTRDLGVQVTRLDLE